MQPTVITGLNGPIYQNFPLPYYGAWNQQILGVSPYHYMIGGTHCSISPAPSGTETFPALFPYIGPHVTFGLRRWA